MQDLKSKTTEEVHDIWVSACTYEDHLRDQMAGLPGYALDERAQIEAELEPVVALRAAAFNEYWSRIPRP